MVVELSPALLVDQSLTMVFSLLVLEKKMIKPIGLLRTHGVQAGVNKDM